MKEVCGFVDSRGIFHETLEAIEKKEMEYRIDFLNETMFNFETRIVDYLRGYSAELDLEYSAHRDKIFRGIAIAVLSNFHNLKKVVDSREEVKKELDSLRKEYKEGYLNKKWWIINKWW